MMWCIRSSHVWLFYAAWSGCSFLLIQLNRVQGGVVKKQRADELQRLQLVREAELAEQQRLAAEVRQTPHIPAIHMQ